MRVHFSQEERVKFWRYHEILIDHHCTCNIAQTLAHPRYHNISEVEPNESQQDKSLAVVGQRPNIAMLQHRRVVEMGSQERLIWLNQEASIRQLVNEK